MDTLNVTVSSSQYDPEEQIKVKPQARCKSAPNVTKDLGGALVSKTICCSNNMKYLKQQEIAQHYRKSFFNE